MSLENALPFRLDLSDELSRWRSETFYSKEPETLEWLKYFALIDSDHKTLVDVGANIGIYSLYWLSFPGTTVIACEPFNENIKILIKNFDLNGHGNRVKLIFRPFSLMQQYVLPIITDPRPGSSGYKIHPTNNLNSEKIQTLTLDQLLSEEKGEIILKIDVDGLDFEILQSAEKTLNSGKIRSLLIESSEKVQTLIETYLKRFGYSPDSRFNQLHEHSDKRRSKSEKEERNRVYSRDY